MPPKKRGLTSKNDNKPLSQLQRRVTRTAATEKKRAATKIQSIFRGMKARKNLGVTTFDGNRFYNAIEIPKLTQNQVNALNFTPLVKENFSKEVDKNLKGQLKRNGNIFFNASNRAFPVNTSVKLAMKRDNATALIKERIAVTRRMFPSVDMDKLTKETKKVARTIAKFVKSGNFLKALQTLGSLFAVVYMFQKNPRAADNTFNILLKQPFLRPIGRTIPSEGWNSKIKVMLTKYFSYFSASPTYSQGIYESFLSTIPGNAYDRSVAGLATQYLAMVLLSLIAILPYEKYTKFSKRMLDHIFKVLNRVFPLVSAILVDVMVERGDTAQFRSRKIIQGALSAAPLVATALRR